MSDAELIEKLKAEEKAAMRELTQENLQGLAYREEVVTQGAETFLNLSRENRLPRLALIMASYAKYGTVAGLRDNLGEYHLKNFIKAVIDAGGIEEFMSGEYNAAFAEGIKWTQSWHDNGARGIVVEWGRAKEVAKTLYGVIVP